MLFKYGNKLFVYPLNVYFALVVNHTRILFFLFSSIKPINVIKDIYEELFDK